MKRMGILIAAVILLGIGVAGAGGGMVWRKASMICLECIGIG